MNQHQNGGESNSSAVSLPAKIAGSMKDGAAAIATGAAGLAGSLKDELTSDFTVAKDAVIDAADKVEEIAKNAEEVVMEKGKSLLESVKRDPIPAAIAGAGVLCLGVGVTWMMINGGRSGANGKSVTKKAVVTKKADAPSKLAVATRATGDKLSSLVQGARSQGLRAGRAAQHSMQENPLAAGAALTAVGVAIGLAIPGTKKEDSWFGKGRDRVVGKAGELARDVMDKVETAG